MTTWTEVTPLVDDAPNRSYWPQFKVGDRVRVRLSGECQVEGEWRNHGNMDFETGVYRGHPDHSNGLVGVVNHTSERYPGHPYRVGLKCPCLPVGKKHAGYFAACELELLP